MKDVYALLVIIVLLAAVFGMGVGFGWAARVALP